MRIGIDIDGVLYPWVDIANELMVERFGIEDPGQHPSWSYLKEKVTKEQWDWLWSPRGQRSVFGRTERVYPGVVQAFGRILDSGHECHFVTHREPSMASVQTAEFLTRHFGSHRWAGLHVVGSHGAPVEKHGLMEWDVFIDDKPETVVDLMTHTEAQVFYPARAWNTELSEWKHPRLACYYHPLDVVDWLEDES